MRRTLVFTATAAIAAVLVGCSEGDPGNPENSGGVANDGKLDSIGLMLQDQSNPFFQSMANGVQAAADDMGATLNIQDGRQDLGAQNDHIDTFIQQQVDVILINAVDSDGIGPAVQRAVDAGIIVIAVDVTAKNAQATVTTDNKQAGNAACSFLAEEIGGRGPILLVDGTPISSVQDRVAGCEEALAKYPDIEIVGRQNGDNGRAEALTITADLLTATPDVVGIFGINDPTALGATLAAEQAGYKDLVIVGVDASPEAVDALNSESMFAGTAAQDPNNLGALALGLAQDLFDGKELGEDLILVETEMVTRDNVAEYPGWQ